MVAEAVDLPLELLEGLEFLLKLEEALGSDAAVATCLMLSLSFSAHAQLVAESG